MAFLAGILTALIYFVAQMLLVTIDGSEISKLQNAICKAAEIQLQTGSIREALDFTNSSLSLTEPARQRHLVLREGYSITEMGTHIPSAVKKTCRPTGRKDTQLEIAVEKRAFHQEGATVLTLALILASIFLAIGQAIKSKTERMALAFFESELSRLFGMTQPSLKERSILSRFYDPGRSKVAERVRANIFDLKSQVEQQSIQLQQQSVRAALGDLVSYVAHDMRSPLSLLSVISARNNIGESGELMNKAIDRLKHLADEVLNTRRELISTQDRRALGDSILSAIEMFENSRGLRVEYREEELQLHARCSPQELVRALTILLENSYESRTSQCEILVRVYRRQNDYVCISVEDNGVGFPESFLNCPASGWHSTKPSGNGLGLPFVYNWIIQKGGDLILENLAEGGARVTLLFPQIPHSAAALRRLKEAEKLRTCPLISTTFT